MHMHEVNAAVLIGSRHLYGYEEIYLHQVLLFIKLMEPASFPILTSLLVGSSFLSMESSVSICLGVPLLSHKVYFYGCLGVIGKQVLSLYLSFLGILVLLLF